MLSNLLCGQDFLKIRKLMIKKKVTTILQQQVNKHFLPDANLIVPDFTIVVFGTLSSALHPILPWGCQQKESENKGAIMRQEKS